MNTGCTRAMTRAIQTSRAVTQKPRYRTCHIHWSVQAPRRFSSHGVCMHIATTGRLITWLLKFSARSRQPRGSSVCACTLYRPGDILVPASNLWWQKRVNVDETARLSASQEPCAPASSRRWCVCVCVHVHPCQHGEDSELHNTRQLHLLALRGPALSSARCLV
jgi:hypothetical protein